LRKEALAKWDDCDRRDSRERRKPGKAKDKNEDRGGQGNADDFSTAPLQCGDVITTNSRLTEDLVCPNTDGFALVVVGDNITLDGNGFKILAPNAGAGLFVQGSENTVRNLGVQGGRAFGIFAYNSPGIKILNNDTSFNQVGIEIYTDAPVVSGAVVRGNKSVGNAAYGVRTGQGNLGQIVNPKISGNDFSDSGSFGMAIAATRYEMDGRRVYNRLRGSENGIFLVSGSFSLHHFSLRSEKLLKTQIFAQNAAYVRIADADVSSTLSPEPSEERTGVDLYRVGKFKLVRVKAHGNDTGLRLQTEQGVSPDGDIQDCDFAGHAYAGISIISYDATPYGRIKLKCNNFYEDVLAGVHELIVELSTVADIRLFDSCEGGDDRDDCDREDDREDDRE